MDGGGPGGRSTICYSIGKRLFGRLAILRTRPFISLPFDHMLTSRPLVRAGRPSRPLAHVGSQRAGLADQLSMDSPGARGTGWRRCVRTQPERAHCQHTPACLPCTLYAHTHDPVRRVRAVQASGGGCLAAASTLSTPAERTTPPLCAAVALAVSRRPTTPGRTIRHARGRQPGGSPRSLQELIACVYARALHRS